MAHTWQDLKGFSDLTITISQTIDEIGDSNIAGGTLKEVSARETTIVATMFADSVDDVYELDQTFADAVGDLDQLSFTVGTAAGANAAALAHQIIIPTPELDDSAPQKLGSKAGNTVSLIARNAVANAEFELDFL